MDRKWFWPGVCGMLAALATVQVLSIRQESQTWDEAIEIAAGYDYLKTGEYRINLEHPPLGRVVAALPLLILNPTLPAEFNTHGDSPSVPFGREFLYHNRVPADTMLFWTRMTTIFTTLCLGLVLAMWVRAEFGAAAALFALLLLAFDPNVIANGRYAKNDMLVTLWCLLACMAWGDYLRRPRKWTLLASGVLLGLAAGTKFSAVFLLPVFLVLAAIQRWKPGGFLRGAGALLLVCAIGFGVVALIYAPHLKELLPAGQAARHADPSIRMLRDVADSRALPGQFLRWLGNRLGLRAHPLFEGVGIVMRHNYDGHSTYLLGKIGQTGRWYYFPLAFAVKTPVATLLILAISLFAWRLPSFPAVIALVPVVVYAVFSVYANIDIGVRHLLPLYPFLFALLGAGMARWRLRYAAVAAALLVAESLAVYPNYLAFFNVAAGGPGRGPRYLLDSNIDWGQDLIKLKSWMDAHGVKEVCNCYFGTADLSHYGIGGPEIPTTRDRRGEADCYAAISVTPLYGLYVQPGEWAWLRDLQPVAKIGYSIYVYDLRK